MRNTRDHLREKELAEGGTSQAASKQTRMSLVDLQRQSREAVQQRKKRIFRIAGGFAIGLHVIGIFVLGAYLIQKKVLEANEDKVESVVLEETKPQPQRRTPPRAKRAPTKPKFSRLAAPRGQSVTTSAKIPVGNARFTLPAEEVSTRPIVPPSTTGFGKNMFGASRQASIVTTMPKFEVPKFQSMHVSARMDMGTNLAQMEFNDPGNLELASVNLGDAKQSFNAFLKAIRDRIKQVQRFPPRVRNLEGKATATVRFTLLKDGTIRSPEIMDSSGSGALDTAALAAVQNAVPYPSFPEEQAGNSLRLEIPIIFELAN